MARTCHMTWVPSRRGWMKEYRGKKYAVSCRQLGVPDNKEASYQVANAWWAAKKDEIDAANRLPARVPQPLDDLAAAYLGKTPEVFADGRGLVMAIMGKLGLLDPTRPRLGVDDPLSRGFSQAIDETVPGHLPETPQESEAWVEAMGPVLREAVGRILQSSIQDGKPLPEEIATQLPPARSQQVEYGIKSIRGEEAAPAERTIKHNADRWVKMLQARVAAGQMAPDQADNLRICLGHFQSWIGEDAPVDMMDSVRLQDFYLWCLQQDWSADYRKKVFNTAKTFIRYLWESGLIELPRNIGSRTFKFNAGAKKIETWTPAECKRVVTDAPGKLKLAILLMVNCGMTQQDVSDLRDDEVDWKAGRIIRKRSKTATHENVPTVNYKLWPQTFKLLKKYRSGTDRVLLTESGKPYVRKELRDGKLVKADGFASSYTHVKNRLKFYKPLKQLRKTAATLLESHATYGRLVQHFLGHAPQSVAARHYAAPPQKLFDDAVTWLGRQLGQVK